MPEPTPRSESSPDSHDGDAYITLAAPSLAETKEKRSRFLATAAPATDEEAARAVVAAVAREHRDCRHVCYAWRIGHGRALRESRHDAGEPGGTAGEPILAAIRRADLTDCVIVVARYFGGIKLGTGGLARAYGSAAEAALAAGERRRVVAGRRLFLRFPYAQQRTVAHLLERHEGRRLAADFGADVTWRIWLPRSRVDDFTRDLAAATGGAIVPVAAPADRAEPRE